MSMRRTMRFTLIPLVVGVLATLYAAAFLIH
jgi:hypothetical protein